MTAGTKYFFQAYANNSEGLGQGAILSFTAGAPTVFSDVPPSYWAYGDITALSTAGYVYGYPDGTFKPGEQHLQGGVRGHHGQGA